MRAQHAAGALACGLNTHIFLFFNEFGASHVQVPPLLKDMARCKWLDRFGGGSSTAEEEGTCLSSCIGLFRKIPART